MTSTGPALLAAAAGVGFGHAILPDHWVPLAVLGRTRRYPLSRIARLSGLAGVAHVLVSIALGAVIIVIGLQFRSTIEHAQDAIIGCILIATGIGFLCSSSPATATTTITITITIITTTRTTTTTTTTTIVTASTGMPNTSIAWRASRRPGASAGSPR